MSSSGADARAAPSRAVRLAEAFSVLWLALVVRVQLWFFTAEPRPSYNSALEATARAYRFFHTFAWASFDPRAPVWSFQSRYPPLLAMLPLPLFFLLGPSPRCVQLVNLGAFLLMLGGVYLAGRELAGREGGLASLWTASTMPLLYGPSRFYLTEGPMAALAALNLFLCLRAARPGRPLSWGAGAGIGIVVGLGLLLKISSPLYAAGPLAALALARSRSGAERAALAKAAAAAAAAAAALAAWWYPFHWRVSVGYAMTLSVGPDAASIPASFAPPGARAYWSALASVGLGWPAVALGAAAALVVALGGPRVWTRDEAPRWAAPALGLALPLAVHTAAVNHLLRYFTPALPCAAVLIGALAARACAASPRRQAAAAAVLLAGAALFVERSIAASPPGPYAQFMQTPSYDGMDPQAVVEAVRLASGTGPARVAVDLDEFPVSWHALLLANERHGWSVEFVDAAGSVPSRCALVPLGAAGSPAVAPPRGYRRRAKVFLNRGTAYGLYAAGADCRAP